MANVVISKVTENGIWLESTTFPNVKLTLLSFDKGVMKVATNFCNIEKILNVVVDCFNEDCNLYGIKQVEFEFNETHFVINKDNANVESLLKEYYENSKQDILLNTTVEFKSEQAKTFWNDLINIGYTVEIIKFAQKWAQHMQEELKKGNILHEIAEKSACKVAKGKDIPVYMHYCAMVILSDVWKYGDELQSWYSHKCSNYYGEPIKLGAC